jgi:hypothetical protein
MQRISHFIHSKLEIILATTSGSSTLFLDGSRLIEKCVLAVILGFLGALGGWLFKKITKRYEKNQDKES